MKQQSIALLIIVVMMMFGAKAYAYDIAVANEDGVTIYYNIINNDTELCVVSGDRVYTCETLVIPETVNYAVRLPYMLDLLVQGRLPEDALQQLPKVIG